MRSGPAVDVKMRQLRKKTETETNRKNGEVESLGTANSKSVNEISDNQSNNTWKEYNEEMLEGQTLGEELQ